MQLAFCNLLSEISTSTNSHVRFACIEPSAVRWKVSGVLSIFYTMKRIFTVSAWFALIRTEEKRTKEQRNRKSKR